MKNDKKITSTNDIMTVYDDGSIDIYCSKCGKEDRLEAENKFAINLRQIAGADRDYLCLKCWKARQDEGKEQREQERKDYILFGQSINLSNMAVLLLHGEEIKKDEKKIPELIRKYQKSYFNLLKELND